jgi:UDP-N-acetylmuramate dehydrogenase
MFVDRGMIPVAWLLDELGLKGKVIGGAKISLQHANFIVNTGNASSEDVIILISFIKQQIRDKFFIQLDEEVQYIGF